MTATNQLELDQEAYKHFKETLETELRQNVKTVIMSLTMLAEDYKASSQLIVKAIEEYIRKVSYYTFSAIWIIHLFKIIYFKIGNPGNKDTRPLFDGFDNEKS